MGARKTGPRKTTPRKAVRRAAVKTGRKVPAQVLFWVFFLALMVAAFFLIFLPIFQRSAPPPPPPEVSTPAVTAPPLVTQVPDIPDRVPAETPAEAEAPAEGPTEHVPAEQPPAEGQPAAVAEQVLTVITTQPEQVPAEHVLVETRTRNIYFKQGNDDNLPLVRVNRSLALSNSPLQDSLNALLQGPTGGEQQQGMVSFIPEGTRILSALVRGNTAYINFSEEFQYNPRGREGAIAQLEQIVWTATEFPNVSDVQILIEGRVINFLSEGVPIGSPIGR